MRGTLLFLVLLKSAISNEESDEKYIDLLPEEEKRQFLEKIARRILEDYHNSNVPNAPHVNISDGELDAHSAYVQGLLQEETQHLRDDKNIEAQRRDDKKDSIKVEENNRKNSAESEKSFVDLTLRSSKREKRRNTSREQEHGMIPVIPVYDEKQLVHNSSENNDTNKLLSTTADTVNEKNNTKILRNSFVYDDESENTPDKIHDTEDNLRSTVIDNFEPSTQESNDESSKENKSVETTTNKDVEETTIIPASWRHNAREGNLTEKENNDSLEHSDEVETSRTITVNPNEISSKTSDESSTRVSLITKSTVPSSSNNVTTGGLKLIDLEAYNTTTKSLNTESTNVTSIETTTPKEISTTTEKITSKSTTVSTTTEATTEKLIPINNVTSKQEGNIDTTTECSEGDTSTKNEASNKESKRTNNNDMYLIEIKRDKPLQNVVNSEEILIKYDKTDGDIEMPHKENKSVYYVYEISAEKTPFLSQDNNEERPYYAPVYNYDPEFAFYNPSNRFGPNDESSNNKESDEYVLNVAKSQYNTGKRRNRFKNLQNTPNQFNTVYNVLKQHNYNNIVDPQRVVESSAIFNPNDYIEMDYFFGRNDDNIELRSGKRKNTYYFPDTDEDDHPYKSMQNSLQDHIRSVRKLLYAHKQFGFIPERPKSHKDYTKRLRTKDLLLSDILKVVNRDDITMDYYFGRKHSDEVNAKHDNLFKLKLVELKDMYTVTPNPIKTKNIDVKGKIKENEEVIDTDALINVLRDMVKMDNDQLVKYDWLGTTVDIQSALNKLNYLTTLLKNNDHIHPNDFELIKYVIYLYKSAQSKESMKTIQLLDTINKLRKSAKKKSLIPKIQMKKKKFVSAIKMWRDFRTFLRSIIKMQSDRKELLRQFESFVAEVQFNLNDLHDAIRHIAEITTFKKQRWYTDLKDVYLKNANKRELLEVVLHLSLSRLLSEIEESSKNGVEENFTEFVKKNRREVDGSRDNFMFVLRLLNEFKRLN